MILLPSQRGALATSCTVSNLMFAAFQYSTAERPAISTILRTIYYLLVIGASGLIGVHVLRVADGLMES